MWIKWQKGWVLPLALAALCLTLPCGPARALDPTKAISQYVHTAWRTADGLPQNSVIRILQTRDGYLWVGTQAGLARFDGVRFTVFDHTNTPALKNDFILNLVEDRQGTLWITTFNGGTSSFRDGVFSHSDVAGEDAGSLTPDSDGSLWVGGSAGLRHIKNGKVIKVYTTANGSSSNEVGRIVIDKDRSVWFATPTGLNRLANGKIQVYSVKDGLPNNDVTDLYATADGTLWVKTLNADFVRWIHGHFESLTIPNVDGGSVRAVLLDRDGNLWIASAKDGLLRLRGEQLSHFTTKDGLSSDAVASLYEDRDGNLWVGTAAGGLDRFRDGSFTTYAKEEGLSADQAYAVIEDRAGDIWVTTPEGLDQLHGNQIRAYKTNDKLLETWALLEDHASNLLVGTSRGGVLRLTDGRLVSMLSERDGIPPYHLSAMLEDAKHKLWLAPRGGGLARYADGKTSVFAMSAGLHSDHLFALAEGKDGTIWVGSDNGIDSIKDGRVARHRVTGDLTGSLVIALYSDSSDTLWIGTFGRGLFRLENGRLTQYTTHQGLPDDWINSIVEDSARNLWIGSDHDVVRLARQDLDAVAAGSARTMTPLVFGKADGIKSAETTGGTYPSVWRARDGRLWFPTNRGVVVVDPMRLLLSDRPLPARVEDMVADDIQASLNAPVRLKPGTRRIEIGYTAPSVSSPERTRFRYRLDGYDEQWVAGGVQRIAQYTNLSPGHYIFHVNAGSTTGGWSAQEATIGFDLIPYFYQTRWFKVLYWLTALLLLWAAYRLRVNWLHAKAAVLEERQRIARDIHDSLAQGLSAIIFHTQAALYSLTKAPEMTSTHMTSVHDLAVSSLDEARYSVWDLSPAVLDPKNLGESISSMARLLVRGRVEALEIHSSGTEWPLGPAANHHVVLIAQEAISNAIQHGHAKNISVNLEYFSEALRLSVSDNGIGFTPIPDVRQRVRGYGMRNMHYRADRLGAELKVASTPGSGTTITLHVRKLGRLEKVWYRVIGKAKTRIDR